MSDVVIVRTGVANLASVLAGLRRLGVTPDVTTDAAAVREARAVVLPGVGAFGAGMAALHEHGVAAALIERAAAGRPLLAVCLGLQLLAASSDEAPGVAGLAVHDGHVARFPDTVKVPQLGWNEVTPDAGCRLLEPGYAYFANSYRLTDAPLGWAAARSDHGGPFVAALERGPILACQFHPELSGPWGLALLDRWLAAAREA
ncbi:MAG: imidazole glycerol phosphate synthase subunit HisH [Deltaproteobacteria bacterium HGW-Deltaproteobacteria-14]|nr:MAG: imidazole glycerol phosphate synthase subunit HisH [Deltaproteobacteria bacterium HGW-Deltaproteobacteria-14]